MKFDELLAIVGTEPVFESALLLAGDLDAGDVRRQLSRWTRAGKIVQLRRGLYVLAPPHRRQQPHPFLVANRLVSGSYVSGHSALAHHGLIPEGVPLTTSVCSSRPVTLDTSLGRYQFRRIKPALMYGYREEKLGGGQLAFVALPEKALLDLVYLVPGADQETYLEELRLDDLQGLDLDRLVDLARRSQSLKLQRAASRVADLARQQAGSYQEL
jgi:predicted transcriptional regulator of viral defense system